MFILCWTSLVLLTELSTATSPISSTIPVELLSQLYRLQSVEEYVRFVGNRAANSTNNSARDGSPTGSRRFHIEGKGSAILRQPAVGAEHSLILNNGVERDDPVLAIGHPSTDAPGPVGMLQVAEFAACEPRPTPVEVHLVPVPGSLYWPSCVTVKRCGGCCLPTQTCIAVSVISRPQRLMKMVHDPRLDYLVVQEELDVDFEEHESCRCTCKVQQQDCPTNTHTYIPHECRCKCNNEEEQEKCAGQGKVWDEKLCACRCFQKTIPECERFHSFSNDSCRCEQEVTWMLTAEELPMPEDETTTARPTTTRITLERCQRRRCPSHKIGTLVGRRDRRVCVCRRRRRNRVAVRERA